MGRWEMMALGCCWLVGVNGSAIGQQAVAGTTKPAVPSWHQKAVKFGEGTPVLGLPGEELSASHCSADGTVFFENESRNKHLARPDDDIYSVAMDGEVKRLHWEMPPLEFNGVETVDFFISSSELVTLFRAEKYDPDKEGPIDEAAYFISTSDHDGDGGKLVRLDIKFRPLKVAKLGHGDFVLLGWDEANLLPELALLKPDGTLRRFIDLDNKPSDGGLDPFTMKGAAGKQSGDELQSLGDAEFSAFGDQVLLAQRWSNAAVHVLSGVGEERKIPVEFPAGFLLRDILPSMGNWTMVVRMADRRPFRATNVPPPPQVDRVFEVASNHGSLVREFTFNTPSAADVTCAPAGKIAAMYQRRLPNAAGADDGSDGNKSQQKTELVVATALR